MRILHTADWHLGKRLDSFSRFEEQVLVMDEIIQIADEQEVDLILIAGDLFDHINPSNEAIDLFYKTLHRLSDGGKRPVIAIAGNHDSPSLIDAPNPLARACGIFLIGTPNTIISPLSSPYFNITQTDEGFVELKLSKFSYPFRLLHVPYANELRLKTYLGEDKDVGLNQILAQSWNNIANQYCDNSGINMMIAHLYMNKKGTPLIEEPDGEKPLKIGNADLIFTESIPDQIQYTALGHIHGAKNIGTSKKPIVYSSSPLCYSFSEAGQIKKVMIIDAEPNSDVKYTEIEITNGRPLFRKTFYHVNDAIEWLEQHPNALVELTLISDQYLKAEDRKKIYQTHDGIIHLIPKTTLSNSLEKKSTEVNLNQNIEDLFSDYFKSKNNLQEPNEEIKSLFQEILKN